jgi:hypothetical protein
LQEKMLIKRNQDYQFEREVGWETFFPSIERSQHKSILWGNISVVYRIGDKASDRHDWFGRLFLDYVNTLNLKNQSSWARYNQAMILLWK